MEIAKTYLLSRDTLVENKIIGFQVYLQRMLKVHIMYNGSFVIEGMEKNSLYDFNEICFEEITDEERIDNMRALLERI